MTPETEFNPELRRARFLPRTMVSPRTLGLIRALSGRGRDKPPLDGAVEHVDGDVSMRVFRPAAAARPGPALLWIHGGGYVLGNAAMSDRFCRGTARELGLVVAAVEYRLAPEHPFPTPLEDCYTGLRWLAEQPDVDPERIAIGGESAGGGLAAALALLARDRSEVRPVLQARTYPMLDDRTVERTDIDRRRLRVWSPNANRFGWRSYLGQAVQGEVPSLAAPARSADLSGLPPAWIGVGTNDLFHDEDLTSAERLHTAGVPCTVHVAPGAYHGFDQAEPETNVARDFRRAQIEALRNALGDEGRTRL